MITVLSKTQKIIYEMIGTSQIVKDIMAKKLEFISDPRNRYISYNHAMDLQTKYYDGKTDGKIEGKDEEREKQRIDYYNRVLRRFEMKYDEDNKFLDDLPLEAYKEIYEMIIDDVSINAIKAYVESLR